MVLVVDDNAADRDLHCLVLRAMGLNAVAAGSGWEGLVCARTLLPALVLTDIRMPGLDGWGLVERLRADPRTAAIPVVVVTGDTGETPRARLALVAALLQKPLDRARFCAAVDAALPPLPEG
jgi:CheY-like chemotaxis protein